MKYIKKEKLELSPFDIKVNVELSLADVMVLYELTNKISTSETITALQAVPNKHFNDLANHIGGTYESKTDVPYNIYIESGRILRDYDIIK